MKLENSFTVDAPAEAAWDLLMDVPRIVPCMPGAALDEVVDDSHWKATMQVKLGPIGLTFATDVERTEADEAAKRVVLKANARDVRNRGRAEATIESSLAPANGATRIDLVTDLALTGTGCGVDVGVQRGPAAVQTSGSTQSWRTVIAAFHA